ncbi:MAG: phosphoribosylformylglycinamidine synthase II [Dehalococcoidia bacterium]|nr:phosphoribosylformylglycinamidine synthase II [Dehalococcoidia bacterium]MQG16140.1 phosphoribosylformylglycinamidine synthase subunit PurL [SAR202 cluster bacterium]|tara:strand:- start:37658 stop:39862 length:2205 start_codon:yes stop_codon:yes gene_type:complete
MKITDKQLNELALSKQEYQLIVKRLGREPNHLELGLFGSLWSEHCGYKHSKLLLKTLPSKSDKLLVEPGVENAGVIDLDDIAVVMKVESHNHPSAIEPYEGAATGVGGIVRDILAMGARPIALLNSLRFGPLSEAYSKRIFEGVVSGISGYGNCIGVPDVGGEIGFSKAYSGNPLVNAMCIGLVEPKYMARAVTGEPGNVLLLVGADTGKDGIHGASGLASQTFEEGREELRPTVQVGNPFLEKILIEACLELIQSGDYVGLQDLGAAGLTSASVECASKSKTGLEIDIDKVPLRESGLSPYEIMLSESQERMLVIANPEQVSKVRRIFGKWGLEATKIGLVTNTGNVIIKSSGEDQADIPVELLTDPPLYEVDGSKPNWLASLQSVDLSKILLPPLGVIETLIKLLDSHNVSSKKWVYEQYDHHVQTNTVIEPGRGDAAVLRLKGSKRAIATSIDGNGRLSFLDPEIGGAIAVAESCRNISCTGAIPLALTDCLNFGNPETNDVAYQLNRSVKGIGDAARKFDVPIVSGNVSLYNESHGQSIYPTPIIGALGIIDDVERITGSGFVSEDDVVFVLGSDQFDDNYNNLAGSEFLEVIHGLVQGQPSIDLDFEFNVQAVCRKLISKGLLKSAHDISEGGLLSTVAESCIIGGIGFRMVKLTKQRWDIAYYGEKQSQIIISVSRENINNAISIIKAAGIPFMELGVVGGNTLDIGNDGSISVKTLSDCWYSSIVSS